MKKTMVALVALCVTGCVPWPYTGKCDAESVAMTSENKKACSKFGFKDGTDGMSGCLMSETNRRNAEYTASIKARKEIERAQWQAVGDSYKQPTQNAPVSTMKSANCVKRFDGSVSCISN